MFEEWGKKGWWDKGIKDFSLEIGGSFFIPTRVCPSNRSTLFFVTLVLNYAFTHVSQGTPVDDERGTWSLFNRVTRLNETLSRNLSLSCFTPSFSRHWFKVTIHRTCVKKKGGRREILIKRSMKRCALAEKWAMQIYFEIVSIVTKIVLDFSQVFTYLALYFSNFVLTSLT